MKRMHKSLKEDCKIAESYGYYYFNVDNKSMAEFHSDNCTEFLAKLTNVPFHGMLSVWKAPEEKPFICFGHDECIFKWFVPTFLPSSEYLCMCVCAHV